MTRLQTVDLQDPCTDGCQASIEPIHDTLQDLAGDPASRSARAADVHVLQVIGHSQYRRTKNVHSEGAEREGGNNGIKFQGDVEAEEATKRGEDTGEECLSAPSFMELVAIGGPYRHEDGAEPGTPCEEDDKWI